jgi:hypothetical protein
LKLRTFATGFLTAATVLLLGAAPAQSPTAKATHWQTRTQQDLETLASVGVDTTPYKAAWSRAKLLLERNMPEESLRAFRRLAADLEGWNPAPAPPRMPADALIDERDPRGGKVRVLAGPRGFGRWRPPSLREKLDASMRGEYRRPLSGDLTPNLGQRISHQKVRERTRAVQTAAARRWQDWMEESDDPNGVASGKVVTRPGGGKVLRYERPEVPLDGQSLEGTRGVGGYKPAGTAPGGKTSALPEFLGVGSYRHAGMQPVVADAAATPPLAGSRGFGSYGHPLRMARAQLHLETLPRYEVPPKDWPGKTTPVVTPGEGQENQPATDFSDQDDPVGDSDPVSGEVSGEEDFLDDEDTPGEEASPSPSTGDSQTDPDDDLDLDDLDEDDDLNLDDDLGGEDLTQTPPKTTQTIRIQDLKDSLTSKTLRMKGTIGRRFGFLKPHVEKLVGLQDMEGVKLFSLEEGTAHVDVLAEAGWIEDLAPGSPVVVEGVFLVDPSPADPSLARLVIADSVSPQ